ncbi:mitotic checkpoint serine/threonine-protein kinase BUB1 [Carcharodon carcharias]|uniref:mitotic checkpoint serine/threonine-protein kinase BUB1 n=1 Tax=Carcharodon carcharias TaxID=13397 RepID=UPI001B7DA89B|nr:mitotic checkpoint serine/threonine-protein kinase BUB1 [Carcharodon carcharias]
MAAGEEAMGSSMDFQECWQMFEAKIQSYAGDDPLDLWDRFLQWAEPLLPPAEKGILVSVLERLVKNFMDDKKYYNDPRYINYWLKLINCSTTPLDFYNYMYNQGVGIKSAALYLAWAQVLEMKGNFQIADSIFQKGIQNVAEPVDMLIHHYGCFRARASQNLFPVKTENLIRSKPGSPGNRYSVVFAAQNGFLHGSLENSQFVSQDLSALNKFGLNAGPVGLETFPKSQDLHPQVLQNSIHNGCNGQQPTLAPCGTESNSLISNASKLVHQNDGHGKIQEAPGELQQVIMYHKDVLFSGDKEMCFEEIRAKDHIARSQHKEKEEWKEMFTASKSDEIKSLEQKLEQLKVQLKLTQDREQEILQTSSQNALQLIPASSLLPTKSAAESSATVLQMKTDRREGNEQNSSLGACAGTVTTANFAVAPLQQHQCGVSSLLPTIDHKQRSSEIQSGFGIYGEPEKSFSDTWAQVDPLSGSIVTGINESISREQFMNRSGNSSRISLSRPREGNVSGLIGNRSHTPNSSFGLVQATPSKVLPSPTVYTKEALDTIMDMFQAPVIPELPQVDENGDAFVEDQMEAQDEDSKAFCKKNDNQQSMEILGMNLAPPSTVPFSIFEDDSGGVNSMQNDLNSKPAESRPWRELSEKQFTASKTKDIDDQAVWAVCDNRTLAINPNDTEDFAFAAPLASTPFYGVPPQPKQDSEDYSEENTQLSNDGNVALRSSEEECIRLAKIRKISPIQDLGSEPISRTSAPAVDPSINCQDVSNEPPISEEFQMIDEKLESCSLLNLEECLKPEQSFCCLQEMYCSDVQFEEPVETPAENGVIIKNPWDKNLINELLSNLAKPLSSYGNFLNWEDNMPAVRPKINLHLGNEVFQVAHLLGQGSFAHVYQATILDMNNLSDVKNQQKVSLKVQKTSNPWEFYISTQLNERLKPRFYNLYNNVYSGHYFKNGSILVGELFSFGTLLNAVNLYKTINEKAMPQPLVIYFAIHILYIMEQLHGIGIIHGDVKPDNFILGERFLDGVGSVDDTLSQGLTLIDFGQSIDMKLFPQNTVFVENCKTSGFQCIEMLSEKPWTFQTDYFGIAATVHSLLFGTYLKLKKEQGVWKVNATFQRGHHADMWNHFFNTLLYIPNCQTLPSLQDLREKLVSLFKELYTKKLKSLRQRLMVLLLENKPSQKKNVN